MGAWTGRVQPAWLAYVVFRHVLKIEANTVHQPRMICAKLSSNWSIMAHVIISCR